MYRFFQFIAGSNGRVIRVLAGLVLILAGFVWIQGVVGAVVAVIGLVPFLAGVFDWCMLAPLFGLPFIGERLRQAVDQRHV